MQPLFTVAVLIVVSAAAAADFETDVYPVLRKAGCAGCHNHDGVASGTRLKFPEGSSSAAVQAFGRSLSVLVNRDSPEKSLLIQKPTAAVAHAGGKRLQPGSEEAARLVEWARHLARGPVETPVMADEEVKPVGPVLRRLTHTQYNNTVRDLLGDDSRIADSFPPEDFVNGFRNQYQAQNTSPLLAEAYTMAAEKLAKKAFAADDIGRIVPCKPGDPACRSRFIRTFGRKAFRRPLTTGEVQRYERLFAASGKTFRDSARTVVEAMLQSPNFLLRTENGLRPEWRPYETASRLSYFLWNTMPDEALFAAAEKGELGTAEGVERVARRMLADPRTRESMNSFVEEWMRFDRLLGTVKDRRTFPQFTPELTLAMIEETRRLFADLVWNNRNFMELYSADYGFVNIDLAKLYGVNTPERDYGRVVFPAATERAGVLSQGAFLAVTSNPTDASPTARGLFVREQFLCQEVPQPPPGVSTNLPPQAKERPRTTRERLGVHLSSEACASCHQLIDPIGFGFEKFDAIGQRRDKQRVVFRSARGEREEPPVTVDLDIDTSGHVAGIPDSKFSSPRELGKILAASAQCQECVVKQLFRYAAGRHETPSDRVVVRRAYEDFKRSGFRFQELMVSLSRWMIYPPEGNDGSGHH